MFACELGEDNTTFCEDVLASVDGTKILDGVAFGINSTGASAPAVNGQSDNDASKLEIDKLFLTNLL